MMAMYRLLPIAILLCLLVACSSPAPTAPPAPPPTSTLPAAPPALATQPASPAAAASVSAKPAASPSALAAASPSALPAAVVASPSPVAQLVGPNGEKLVEQSAEVRFQLDLQVTDSGLAPYLPAGWTSNVAASGAAKDANLRAIFLDRVTVNGPNGMPLGSSGSNRQAVLIAPVKDQTGAAVQLVIGGITEDPGDAPGPFGNYLPAKTHTMQRSTSTPASGDGPLMDSQDWVFESNTGEHLEVHVKYDRGNAARAPASDTRYYSAKNPSFYQLSRQEQVLDILRNVTTTPPDRVHEFSFVGNGGAYSRIFDGKEKVLSWDNVLWINRTVFQP